MVSFLANFFTQVFPCRQGDFGWISPGKVTNFPSAGMTGHGGLAHLSLWHSPWVLPAVITAVGLPLGLSSFQE